MEKIIAPVFCLILCGILLSGCSFVVKNLYETKDAIVPIKLSNDYKTASWSWEDGALNSIVFDKISFAGDDDDIVIKIVHADAPRVEATYSKDLDNYGFNVDINDGQIKVSVDKQRSFITKKFILTIYANFDKIVVAGGLPLSVDASDVNDLYLDISGGVEAGIYNVNAQTVYIDAKGAADIEISGMAENFSLEIAGAGELDGKRLLCKSASIEISGAGEADISVTDDLYVKISGAGEVEYYGSPDVTNNSNGVAELKQKSPETYAIAKNS